MATDTKPAPTSVDVGALAIRIQEKLEQAEELLTQAAEDAEDLFKAAENVSFERFQHAVCTDAEYLSLYLGPDHAGSSFYFDNALQLLGELLELMQYATRKDG